MQQTITPVRMFSTDVHEAVRRRFVRSHNGSYWFRGSKDVYGCIFSPPDYVEGVGFWDTACARQVYRYTKGLGIEIVEVKYRRQTCKGELH